jgi:hypothetical protein
VQRGDGRLSGSRVGGAFAAAVATESGLLFATDAIKAWVGGIPLPLLRACFVAKGHPPVKYTFLFL